ncbi:MAG TPA: formate dehydrogenase accessory sulfurtransferase FdhD [Candidatus Polarisedimenticolia bacterium]|jgi:FdhD protein|nr:formate dehydrogenase accessory sulfurtransferase FdhD [Candidatus Polarisedimenticolia bacterium]
MPRDPVELKSIWKVRDGRATELSDWMVVEEPLEIRVRGEALAVIMRTPGHDIELAAGFSLTEGVVPSFDAIESIRQCQSGEAGEANVVDVTLAPGAGFDPGRMRRNLMASAACGLCGKASLEALATRARPVESGLTVRREVLASLPGTLLEAQESFGRTGALHAAALFDPGGRLRVCREDVGRHNAVDKVVGRMALDGLGTGDSILLVSGRTSFEILQKAAVAGIPIVCAISGPTTLAVDTARAFRITLVNFLRDSDMNIASCPERVAGI